jgi:YVTN family beta-propeller protein
MDFRILGSLEVYDNGRPLPLGGHQQRALLALLLLRANQVVPVDEIVEDLWGARPPPSATKSAQALVSKLRRLLADEPDAEAGDVSEDGILLTRSPGYVLTVVPGELDLHRFQALTEEGRRALAAGRAEDAAKRLREALGLWRGPPLAELAYDSFAQVEIARLEELRLSALEERIEADLALGRHHDLIPEVEALVTENPLRERLRGQLMLALYRSGRQAEALQAYQRARHTLVDELGIEPGQALQRLEQAILQQDESLDLSGGPAPTAEVATREPPVQTLSKPEHLSGAVTFLFTDIEGSTRLVKQLRERWGAAVADHQRILREAFAAHRGQEIDTHGDAFFVAFGTARDAVLAAAEGQRALAEHPWPEGAELRVRMGLHSGQAAVSGERYLGLSVHRAARICQVAYGGQVLLSQTAVNLLEDEEEELPGIELRDLGEQRLKDLDRPVRLSQLVIEGLPSEFPPLGKAGGAGPFTGREEELAEAAEAVLSGAGRRRRLLFGLATIAAAGIATLVALVAFRGNESITVLPNSVAVIDPNTNKLVADVPVGRRPGAVAFGEGAVWVANLDESTLSRINPKTREVERLIAMEGVLPSDVAAGNGGIWVADGRSNTVVRVSPGANEVVDRIPTRDCAGYEATIAVGEGAVWFVCDVELERIDPLSGHALPLRYLGLGPRGIATGLGAVWVSNGDNTVSRISARTNQVTDTANVADDPRDLATGYGAVWVSAFAADKISRIAAAEAGVGIASETIQVGDGPVDVAAGAAGVWVANSRDGTVSRIDPHTNEVVETIRLGKSPQAIAVGGGAVWVTVQAHEPGGLNNQSSDAHP